jgi:uncharacterized membrane protein
MLRISVRDAAETRLNNNSPDGSGSFPAATIGSRTYIAAAILILIVAMILRLLHLGEISLWIDEATLANLSRTTTLQHLIDLTRSRFSSPLGMPLLAFIIEKFSVSTWILRFPSVLFSVGAIAIILALPRVGISRGYCLAAAAVLAISWSQIRYAQELREYALSVFVVAVQMYLFFQYLEKSSLRNQVALTIGIVAAPFLAYGSCFSALAIIVCTAIIQSDRGSKGWLLDVAVMTATFVMAAIFNYLTVAKYQEYALSSEYLAGGFPPVREDSAVVWIARSVKWLLNSFQGYIGWDFAGFDTAALFIFLIVVSLAHFVFKPARLKQEPTLLLFVVLVGGSVLAGFLRLYPFGPIRHQLYAAPVVTLAIVRAGALLWSQFDIQWRRLTFCSIVAIVLATSAIRIPAVYYEREDILSAVKNGLMGASLENVYVYYGAVPAVDFYYPDTGWKRGTWLRGNVAAMADEASRVASDRQLYLIFSHIYSPEDDLLIAELQARGWLVVWDKKYNGSRAVELNRPRLSTLHVR